MRVCDAPSRTPEADEKFRSEIPPRPPEKRACDQRVAGATFFRPAE